MNKTYTMYGAEFSYYSGKLRSYLRKKGIPFREIAPSSRLYRKFIVPRTGVRYIPVLRTPQDEVLQDTTVIIDFLETRFPGSSIYPQTPKKKLAALLLELFGDEWMLLPAMHYRWNFPSQNLPFIYREFGQMLFPRLPKFAQLLMGRKLGNRFKSLVPLLGITGKSQGALQAWYESLLDDLEAHFSTQDFLLGSTVTIGDFGMIASMYAHLYRDPAPGKLMRNRAPAVVGWVERMMLPQELPQAAFNKESDDDVIPGTVMPVLQRIAADQLPVLADTARCLQSWADKETAAEVPRRIGMHEVNINGVREQRLVLPYALWMFQRPLDYWRSLEGEARRAADQLLTGIGALDYFRQAADIRLERVNNRYYLAHRV